MRQLPRWKRNDGADFVIYDPHPGFADGQAEHIFLGMLCNEFRQSTQIVSERAHRNTCQV